MNIKFIIKIFLLVIPAIFFAWGCSASSGSKRYESDRINNISDSTNLVRFAVEPVKMNLDSLEYSDSDIDDMDDIPENSGTASDSVLISRLLAKYNNSYAASLNTDSSDFKEKVIMEIIKYLNTPYKFGGNSWKGIDCSAFTQNVFEKSFSLELPRSAREQYTIGQEINDRSNLKFGDLVFFNTRRRVKPGHVGIYIGENLFAHASRKAGVTVSSLDNNYYSNRYMGARRIEGLPVN
jgi:cell wall-associated NlpC family hydrolase